MINKTTMKLEDGNYFDLANPLSDGISIELIAEALGRLCRYTGHGNRFYSVAEHSVLVSTMIYESCEKNSDLAMHGLLHDAHEAFVGDLSRPLKEAMALRIPNFKVDLELMTDDIDACIYKALFIDLPSVEDVSIVKQFDDHALNEIEICSLFSSSEKKDRRLQFLLPDDSAQLFLDQWSFLRS